MRADRRAPYGLTQDMLVKRTLQLLALVALLLSLAPAPPARAQAPPVTLEVLAGYDESGQFRVGHWFPVTILVGNDGPDLRGALEWRFPGDDGGVFRYTLDLPNGARKRITLPVVSSEANGSGSVVLLAADGTQLLRQAVRLDPISSGQLAVGVLSSEPTLLNSLGALTLDDGRRVAVTHLDPARLPEDAALLAGLDVLFVHDLPTADLSTAQREALALWTRLGGELVVGGGPNAERTAPGLDALLPAEVGQLQPGASTAALGALVPNSPDDPPALTVSALTPREGATALDGDGLVVARAEGAGRVLLAAFDLAALRAWSGEAQLWAELLEPSVPAHVGQSFRLRSENLLRDALQLQGLNLPSTAVLLLLMILYIVVIGPVNFLLLRRAGRVELAWISTPLLVVLFLAASYGASIALRGTRPQISQLAVVQGFEGDERAQATAFLGIFSPQRRSYSLGFAPTVLVTPGTFEGFSFRSTPVTADGAAVGVDDLLIDVSSLRTLMVEQPVALAPQVQSSLRLEQGRVEGELTLVAGPALRDPLVVFRDSAQQLDDLQPGASASVAIARDIGNFPDQVALDEDGIFNHNRVMYSLFGYDRFAVGGPTFQGEKGLPDPEGVYLLGWAEGAALDASIDGDGERQQGETLYMIRLDTRP
jgi:hypothetical protein